MFYGNLFDNKINVNHEVDSFIFPSRKDVEKEINEELFHSKGQELIVREDIEGAIIRSLPVIYSDLMEAEKELAKDVATIAEAHGIPAEVAASADVRLGDDEEKITQKLYRKQAEELAERNLDIKRIYEELVSLNPTDENYQEELLHRSSDLLSRIPQQNKEELSRYVIRREMVANVLKLILNQSLEYQRRGRHPGERRDKEGLIHDLIIRRRSDSTRELNDLWVLNEEFVHFEGCSDLPISQITLANGEKLLSNISPDVIKDLKLRPDIFLFVDEGKCILIELKPPDEDLSDHLNQMRKYCNLIANYAAIPITRFYCYLIGEEVSMADLPPAYERTVNDDWVLPEEPIRSFDPSQDRRVVGHIYSEIVLLSSVATRAERRNRSFAERLGIRIS